MPFGVHRSRTSVYHTDHLPTSVGHEKSKLNVPHFWRAIVRKYAASTHRGDIFAKRKRANQPPPVITQLFHHDGADIPQSTDDSEKEIDSRHRMHSGSRELIPRTPNNRGISTPRRIKSGFTFDDIRSPSSVPGIGSDADDLGTSGIVVDDLDTQEEFKGWQEYRHTTSNRLLYFNESEMKISKLPSGEGGILVDTDPRAQNVLLEYAARKSKVGVASLNDDDDDDEENGIREGKTQNSLDVLTDALGLIKAKVHLIVGAAENMSSKILSTVKQLQQACEQLETHLAEEETAETNDVDYIMGWKRANWNFDNDHVHRYRASMAPTLDQLQSVTFRDWHCPKNFSNQPLPPSAGDSFDADMLLPEGCVKTKTVRRIGTDTTVKRVIFDLFRDRALSANLSTLGSPDEFCLKAVGYNDYMTDNDVLFQTEYVRECLRYKRKIHFVMVKTPIKSAQDIRMEKECEEYVSQFKRKIKSDIVKEIVDWSDLTVPDDVFGTTPSNRETNSGAAAGTPTGRRPYMSVSGRVSVMMPKLSKKSNYGKKTLPSYGWRGQRQWPLRQLSIPFSVNVVGASNCTRRALPRLENSQQSMLGVNMFFFLGAKRILMKDAFTGFQPTNTNPRWLFKLPNVDINQMMSFDPNASATITYNQIPRGARLGVLLWERGRGKSAKKDERAVLGWAVIQLVDELGRFVQGDHHIRLWKMEKKENKYVASEGLEKYSGKEEAGLFNVTDKKGNINQKAQMEKEYELNTASEWLFRESNRANCFTNQEACTIHIRFPTFPVPIVAPILYPFVVTSINTRKEDVDWRSIKYDEQLTIKDVIKSDALEDVRKYKDLLWKCRSSLAKEPGMLSKVLQCADWSNMDDVHEAHRLLLRWAPPLHPNLALQFLDYRFCDPLVREYGVNHLKRLTDAELRILLLQLVQCLKYEAYHDSPLSRFLIMRALSNPIMVGHFLFWHLQAEMSFAPTFYERYQVILEVYLSMAGRHTIELRKQLACVRKLEVVSDLIMRLRRGEEIDGGGKDCNYEYKERLQQLNQDFFRRIGSLHNPLNPRIELSTLFIDKCNYMSSKMVPLWLVFKNKDPNASRINPSMEKIYVIFKTGDDLRQDSLTLQILQLMDRMWLKNKLDMRLSPYQTVATGFNRRGTPAGLIEVVLNSNTTEKIQNGYGGALNWTCIDNYLREHNEETKTLPVAKDNFARSCAGYCVATYTLGIGDRHSGNIMCKRDGHLFHIDFGHFLGNFKSKYGIKRERTAFVFTPEMAYVMSGKKGVQSAGYRAFVELAKDAFWVVRGNAVLWET
eukprot:CAMPEP_0114521548 /NCGR_PEP_ID=MMETSP0109-20121206/20242_1 /TAXON_ID=29199 /ORGANISM="Chlorarachnion reptans, Strain CCCM449" /LENGTH=1293 /DNA_ID=CAMNT_0001702655 /DNA_START=95 /DNA_END=3972 /DNA_ORIENTATION=-